jgi:catechol 2,3-dioxygenase-like lactoylglutathione lyase family enzyme
MSTTAARRIVFDTTPVSRDTASPARYDDAGENLDRHASYIVTAVLAPRASSYAASRLGIPSGGLTLLFGWRSFVSDSPLFKNAFPYQADVLALPVVDLEAAARWYSNAFGLREVERREQPHQAVILERDGVEIGFALTGGDASQDGAAIQVSDLDRAKDQIERAGVQVGNERVEVNDGERRRVFFVVAPDGLCFYFYEISA